ncbi:DUF2213 domain-containing protein [Leptospira santarosai]|uniref:DUF2213 domain-containing protein n=1 Tax=Leptospira santarosai TaxID=28183 RepID=UPI0002BFCE46|nr:DUF2213 domain-containing protein [Leptospira santarosai]EMO69748.1 PF09979 family protein [Leptospira santarosai str. 200403458]EMO99767.1 PF09979 family protein [Leptospira santarosai str. 200702252]EMP81970.1 PF09979 family protein [Leptospira santarosai str. CBC1531]
MYELRLDTGTFTLLERGHNFARYKGVLSKPGVLDYPELNRKELIPEEELFHADTKRSFRGVPMVLTDRQNLHPGKIDSDNFREHIVGALGDNVREESGQLVAEFTIYDRETSRRIDSGELSQLSIARTMIPVEKNGSHKGKEYQVIQTNIRGNHVALTPRGRAGKDARVLQRTDSKEDKMAVVSYRADSDGKDHDIPSEVAKDIEVLKSKKEELSQSAKEKDDKIKDLEEKIKTLSGESGKDSSKEIEDLKRELEIMKALSQTAKQEADAWKKKAEELQTLKPDELDKAVKERAKLIEQGKAIVGDSEDFSGLSNSQIKDKIISKALPYPSDMRSDSITDVVREAQFSAAIRLSSALATKNPSGIRTEERGDSKKDYRLEMHNWKGDQK